MKIKINPDKEKAESILKIVVNRIKFVLDYGKRVYPTVICENYYEIIKEISTAIFLTKGIKFIGKYAHKELFQEIAILMKFDESTKFFLEDFRDRRNGSMYYGESFDKIFLENYTEKILEIIKKLEFFLKEELKREK